MKLLVIGNVWPHAGHTVRAANVVIYELVRALAAQSHSEVGYLRVRRSTETMPVKEESTGAEELAAAGVTMLDELVLEAPPRSRPAWLKLLNPRRSDFYPDSVYEGLVKEAICAFAPDMVLIPWSEWITALCANLPIVKFAYYGNPDHKAATWRIAFDKKNGIPTFHPLRVAIYLHLLEREHLRVMKQYELLGNVAANDAAYYVSKGHQNAFYIQNIWIDRFGPEWETLRERAATAGRPAKIIVNVGQLGGTANRYGLEILGKELAPLLRNVLAGITYELHVLGLGQLAIPLKSFFDSPEIKLRGFVEDIDEEMFGADLFVCLNNGSPFKVGHTRYLHAWSLGSCVVAHRDAALSMPEMRHRENCLLGADAHEIAALIHEAIEHAPLRKQIGIGGYATFRQHFIAERVGHQLWSHILNPLPNESRR